MARRRKKGHDDHGGGGGGGHGGASGRWLVSYADFITLMFVVFLVLFSMARLDAAKYGTLARSLHQALGPVGPDIPPLPARGQLGTAMPVVAPERPGNVPDVPDWPAHLVAPHLEDPIEREPIPPAEPPPSTSQPDTKPSQVVTAPPPAPPSPPRDPMQDMADVFRGLPGVRTGLLAVALEERGIVLTLAGKVLFNPGEYTLKPEATAHLDEIALKLKGVEVPIMISGSTDLQEALPSGMTHLEVSTLRAGAVLRYFTEVTGVPAKNFVFFGYGDTVQTAGSTVTIIVARTAR
ncbi:MAG: flagellar motor protein MotB [Bacillota bacterium]